MWTAGLRDPVPPDRALGPPSSSTPSGSVLPELLSELLTGSSSTTSTQRRFGGICGGSVLEALISEYLYLPGFSGFFMATDAFASGLNTAVANAMNAAFVATAAPGAVGALVGAGNAAGLRSGGS
jgi:hypothetical protein